MKTELDLLGLPNMPRIVLSQAPLVLALCQVRFSNMLSATDPASLSAFQRAIQSTYPVAHPTEEIEVRIGLEPNDLELRGEQRRSAQWQFTDQNDNWKIVLAQDFLTLETRNYEHFDDFLTRLQEALAALVRHIQPTIGTRLGLRYINEIRVSDFDDDMGWSEVIRQDLLGPLAVPELIENTAQIAAIQQLLLRYPNNLGINIHHGLMLNGTTVRLHPGEEVPNGAFYLLDFDVFQDFSLPQPLKMDPKIIGGYVVTYHKMIYRLFRWSVTRQYISKLEG